MRKLLLNRLFVSLLCFTLLFKVIVPVGFMPDLAALQHGVFKITICSGVGAKEIFVDQSQKQVNGSQKDTSRHGTEKSGDGFCPFSGLHGALVLASLLVAALLLYWQQILFITQAYILRAICLASAYPRGPPLYLA